MTSSGLTLHLRERRVPATVAGVVAVVVFTWLAGEWLRTRPYFSGADARVPAATLGPLLVAVLVGQTFDGADPHLTSTTGRIRRPQRALHAVVLLVVPAALIIPAGLQHPGTWGAWAMARNAAGLIGLVVTTVAFAGARLCWAPVFAYVVTVYLAAPHEHGGGPPSVWAWPMQPSTDWTAWLTAATLTLISVVTFTVHSPPRAPVSADD